MRMTPNEISVELIHARERQLVFHPMPQGVNNDLRIIGHGSDMLHENGGGRVRTSHQTISGEQEGRLSNYLQGVASGGEGFPL